MPSPHTASEQHWWQAVVQNDPTLDGILFYAVKTTGIYCRPSCPSKLPKRENVLFFASCAAAESAGFRPCKRCQPKTLAPSQQQADMIAKSCDRINAQLQASAPPPSLAEMAKAAGLSPHHFHRIFKKIVGITPHQYAATQRKQLLQQQLKQASTVTQALYNSGFESGSTFYASSSARLGMTPAQYQQGAKNLDIQYSIRECWLGLALIAATSKGICAIAFDNSATALVQHLQTTFPKANLHEGDAAFQSWVEQALQLIESPEASQGQSTLPLDIQGTAFQQQVWQALMAIAPGSTLTYSQLAQTLNKPNAVRAVASACAKNQIAIAIPCHRIIGSDGKLRGYRWGCDRKQALLERESKATKSPARFEQPTLFT
jgi:AraC family transcriptional regulator, regulatory protein of adaptative response / methylated-DNA-[protein]-cysteine methyltransferase